MGQQLTVQAATGVMTELCEGRLVLSVSVHVLSFVTFLRESTKSLCWSFKTLMTLFLPGGQKF